MQCFKRKFLALAVLALLTFLPNVSFAAAATCECFCGVNGDGATSYDKLTNSACQTKCVDLNKTKIGTKFVGCYTDTQEYPSRNPKCWREDECKAWTGKNGTVDIKATWQTGGEMPYECQKNKTSGEKTGYCYADGAKYKLNIAVGSLTEVDNIPIYINAIYTWLLPAAALVAVVMMMIGGFQYVLSRGKEKYITKSRDRITNAITGLIILLSIFVILNLIDPRLTSLNTLRIPMIKEVTMLDSGSSCENLADHGYNIQTEISPALCGGSGFIKDSLNLEEGVLGAWKDGDPCDYMKCTGADAGKICATVDKKNTCLNCALVPNPSATICASLQSVGKNLTSQLYCIYTDTWEGLGGSGPTCLSVGVSNRGSGGLNCTELQNKASITTNNHKTGCEVYEDLEVGYSAKQVGFDNLRAYLGRDINVEVSAFMLEKVCNDDYCNVAKSIGATSCVYSSGATNSTAQALAAVHESFGILDFFGVPYDWMKTGYYCKTVK